MSGIGHPRSMLKPGAPVANTARARPAAMPPPPPPPPFDTARSCVACQGARWAHTCHRQRQLGTRWQGAAAGRSPRTPQVHANAAEVTGSDSAEGYSSARKPFGSSGSSGRYREPVRAVPSAAAASSTPSEIRSLGEAAPPRAAELVTPTALPKQVDGWRARRLAPRELDKGRDAKRARQVQARLQPDARQLDPASLPQHLFASTATATIELVQATTEHARACKGSFMPPARKAKTEGLVACFTFHCNKGPQCTEANPSICGCLPNKMTGGQTYDEEG